MAGKVRLTRITIERRDEVITRRISHRASDATEWCPTCGAPLPPDTEETTSPYIDIDDDNPPQPIERPESGLPVVYGENTVSTKLREILRKYL